MKRLYYTSVFLLLIIAAVACTNEDSRIKPDLSSKHKVIKGDGWRLEYPEYFDKVSEHSSNPYIQEVKSGKTISIEVATMTLDELRKWIQSEIERKLSADHADQKLVEPLEESMMGEFKAFRYTIHSDPGDGTPVDIPVITLFDGSKMYEFRTHIPPFTKEEFEKKHRRRSIT